MIRIHHFVVWPKGSEWRLPSETKETRVRNDGQEWRSSRSKGKSLVFRMSGGDWLVSAELEINFGYAVLRMRSRIPSGRRRVFSQVEQPTSFASGRRNLACPICCKMFKSGGWKFSRFGRNTKQKRRTVILASGVSVDRDIPHTPSGQPPVPRKTRYYSKQPGWSRRRQQKRLNTFSCSVQLATGVCAQAVLSWINITPVSYTVDSSGRTGATVPIVQCDQLSTRGKNWIIHDCVSVCPGASTSFCPDLIEVQKVWRGRVMFVISPSHISRLSRR